MLSALRDPLGGNPHEEPRDLRPDSYTPKEILNAIEQYRDARIRRRRVELRTEIERLARSLVEKPYSDVTLRSVIEDLLELGHPTINQFLAFTPPYKDFLTSKEWYQLGYEQTIRHLIAEDMDLVRKVSAPSLVVWACQYTDKKLAKIIAKSPQIIAMLSFYDIDIFQRKFPSQNAQLARSLEAATHLIQSPERKAAWMSQVRMILLRIFPISFSPLRHLNQASPLSFVSVLKARAKCLPTDLKWLFRNVDQTRDTALHDSALRALTVRVDQYTAIHQDIKTKLGIIASSVLTEDPFLDWYLIHSDQYKEHLTATELEIIGQRSKQLRMDILSNPEWVKQLGTTIFCKWGITDDQDEIINHLLNENFDRLGHHELLKICEDDSSKELYIAQRLMRQATQLPPSSTHQAKTMVCLLINHLETLHHSMIDNPDLLIEIATLGNQTFLTWLEMHASLEAFSPAQVLRLIAIHPQVTLKKCCLTSIEKFSDSEIGQLRSLITSQRYFNPQVLFDLAVNLDNSAPSKFELALYCAKVAHAQNDPGERVLAEEIQIFLTFIYARQRDFGRTQFWLQSLVDAGFALKAAESIELICSKPIFNPTQQATLRQLVSPSGASSDSQLEQLLTLQRFCALSLEDTTGNTKILEAQAYRKEVALMVNFERTSFEATGGDPRLRTQTDEDLDTNREALTHRWESYHQDDGYDADALVDDISRLKLGF